MASIKISYNEAKNISEEAVKSVLDQKSKSKGACSKVPLNKMVWTVDWSVRHDGLTFDQIMAGAAAVRDEKDETWEEYLADLIPRLYVNIKGVAGRGHWYAKIPVPQILIDDYHKSFLEDKAEEARVAALTPEQFAKETEDTLRELSKSGSFAMFRVPRK